MSKSKIPNQRNRYAQLNGRLNKYALLVQDVYDSLNLDAAKVATSTGHEEGIFRFTDYPQTKDAVIRLQNRFVREMRTLIYSGTSEEWRNSNLVQDLIANKVLKSYNAQVHGEKTKIYYLPNNDALKAFQERTEKGMNLSSRLWVQSEEYKRGLEAAISSAIEKGMSAVTLSKRVSKYLNDFPSLKADYKERFGKAVDCHDCEYASIRLARSEINMAYRTAEQKRWEQMDFVVGYEVKTTQNGHHKEDICDLLAGKYPKEFHWVGWHPNCMCYEIPILKTEEEFWAEDSQDNTESENEVTELPDNFNEWVQDNQKRIEFAHKQGTLPYFVRDNFDAVQGIINPEEKVSPIFAQQTEQITVLRAALNNGLLPKETASVLDRLQELAEMGDDAAAEEFAQRASLLQAAADRHAARTQDYRENILVRLEEREKALTATKEEKELQQLRKDVADEISKLPGRGWNVKINGSLEEKLRKLLDNYDIVSPGFTSATRQALDHGLLSQEQIKLRIDRYKKDLSSRKEKMDILAIIHNADLTKLPKAWLEELKKELPQFSNITTNEWLSLNPSLSVERNQRRVLHLHNAVKLSQDKLAQKYGLEKLSTKTPVEIFERFVKKDADLAAAIPDKKFFDGLKYFVPLRKTTGGAYCIQTTFPEVYIPSDDRRRSIFGLKEVLTHEYGHAYSRLSATSYMQVWKFSDTELRKDYDALKSVITPQWRTKAIGVIEKARLEAQVCKLSAKEQKIINDWYDEELGKINKQTVDFSTRYKLREELMWEKKKKLGLLESEHAWGEVSGVLSDIVEGLTSKSLGYGGHGKDYFSQAPGLDLEEFIAECSSARHLDFSLLKKAAPEIYKIMQKYGKKYWP